MKGEMDEKYIAMQQLAKDDTPASQIDKIDFKEYIDTVFYHSNDYEELVHRLAPLEVVIMNQISKELLHLIGQSLFEILNDGLENEKKIYLLKFYNNLLSNAHTAKRIETSTVFSLEEMDLFKLLDHLLVVKEPEVQTQELLLLHQLLPKLDKRMANNFFPSQPELQEALVSFKNTSFNDGVRSFLECLHTKDQTFSIETIWMKIGNNRISVLGNDNYSDDIRTYVDFNCSNKTVSFRHCMVQTQSVFAVVQYDNIKDISRKEFVQIEVQEFGIKLKTPIICKNINKIKGRTVRFRFSTRHLQVLSKLNDDSFLNCFFANSKGLSKVKQRVGSFDKETIVTYTSVGILKRPTIPDTPTDELITTSSNNEEHEISSHKCISAALSCSNIENNDLSSLVMTDALEFESFEKEPPSDLFFNSLQVETGVPDSDQFNSTMQFETNTNQFQRNTNSMEFSTKSVAKKLSSKLPQTKDQDDIRSEDQKFNILSEFRSKNTDLHTSSTRDAKRFNSERYSDSDDSIFTKSTQKLPSPFAYNIQCVKDAVAEVKESSETAQAKKKDKWSSGPNSSSIDKKKRNAVTIKRAQHDALNDLRFKPIVEIQKVPKEHPRTCSGIIKVNPKDSEYFSATQASSRHIDKLFAGCSHIKGQRIDAEAKTKPLTIQIKNTNYDCSLKQSTKKTGNIGKKMIQKALPLKSRTFNHESTLMPSQKEVSVYTIATKKVGKQDENTKRCGSKGKHRNADIKTIKGRKALTIKTTKPKKSDDPVIDDAKEINSGFTVCVKNIDNAPNVVANEILETNKVTKISSDKIVKENEITVETKNVNKLPVATSDSKGRTRTLLEIKSNIVVKRSKSTKEVDSELISKKNQSSPNVALESTEGINQIYSETLVDEYKKHTDIKSTTLPHQIENLPKPNDNEAIIPTDFVSVATIDIQQEAKTNLNTMNRKHEHVSVEDNQRSDVIERKQKEFAVLMKNYKKFTLIKERTVEDIRVYDSAESRHTSTRTPSRVCSTSGSYVTEKHGLCANFDSGIQIDKDKEMIATESPDLFESDEIMEFPPSKIARKSQSASKGKSDIMPKKLVVQECSPLHKLDKSLRKSEKKKRVKVMKTKGSKESKLCAPKTHKRVEESVDAIIEHSNSDHCGLESDNLFDSLLDDQTRAKRAARINAAEHRKRASTHQPPVDRNYRLTEARKRDIRNNISSIMKASRPRKRSVVDIDLQGLKALPAQFQEDFRKSLGEIKQIVSNLKTQLYQIHLNAE